MPIEWRKNLEIGVAAIDEQHKELFVRFNDLLDACNQGRGRDEVSRLLNFLSSYVRIHFSAEERLQLRHDYPFYEEHRQQHEKFIADLARLEEQLDSEGASIGLVIETNKITTSWLIRHISRMDKELGEYIRSNS